MRMESSDPEQEGGGNVDALLAESSPQEYLNPRSLPSFLSFLLPFLQVSTVQRNWSFNSSEELIKHSPTVLSSVSFFSYAAGHVWLLPSVSLPGCNLPLVNHCSDLFAEAVAAAAAARLRRGTEVPQIHLPLDLRPPLPLDLPTHLPLPIQPSFYPDPTMTRLSVTQMGNRYTWSQDLYL